MVFITGLMLIDAPASALNNSNESVPGARTDNSVGVKYIRTTAGATYPYVSAQAFRAWLRATLARVDGWAASPTYREEKVAYSDGNPILFSDDDLLGYMRAESKKESAVNKRSSDTTREGATPTAEIVTRIAPFRVGTLVSIAPVIITTDFGVMARQEGDAVPYEHQFYRTTLQSLFSLDLRAAGTFTYRRKTGYQNLDENRRQLAKERGLEHLENEKAYRLPIGERVGRVRTLLGGLGQIEGGAKQTLHYTDVSPVLTMLAVTRGGNNIFGHVVGANKGVPSLKLPALAERLDVFGDTLLSPVYVGWVRGYMDDERERLEMALAEGGELSAHRERVIITHPRSAFQAISDALAANTAWME